MSLITGKIKYKLILPFLAVALPMFVLLFVLPEKQDSIGFFRNELLTAAIIAFLLVAAIGLLLLSGRLSSFAVKHVDIIVLAFFCWLFINEWINNARSFLDSTKHAHQLLLAGCLYLLVRFDKEALENICLRYLFPLLWYAVILYGVVETLQHLYATGQAYFDLFFTNPGKAGVLIVLLGILNIHLRIKKHMLIPVSISMIVALVLVLISGSRSAWVGGIVAGSLYFIRVKKLIDRKWLMLVLFAGLMLIIAAVAFLYKSDSGWGRVLIWKVILENWPAYLLQGPGIDKFGAIYNEWQSNYFSSQLSSINREAYLADNTFFAFNEYLHFAVELGAVPVLVFMTWLLYSLFQNRQQIKPAYKLFFVAAAVSACTFYTFHLPIVQWLFVMVLGFIANSIRTTIVLKPSFRWLLVLPAACLFNILIASGFLLKGVPYWEAGRADIEYNEADAYEAYKTAATYLKSEGQFMIEFAFFLATNKKYHESIQATKQSQLHRTYQSTFLNYGYCYEQLGNTAVAETYYQQAIACIPSRLGPRYKLILLYDHLHNKNKVQQESQRALTLSLKNPNDALSIGLQQAIRKIYIAHVQSSQ